MSRLLGYLAVVAIALAMHQPVAAGPNANARLSLDIDASDNKMNDGHTSGTVAGTGTDVVVEVFITGLAGPIIGGEFSIDTNRLTVKSAAGMPGLSVLGTTATTVAFGGFPPGVTLSNGYLGTVTLTTTSDVTNVAFTVSASMNVGDGTNIGETDMLTAATPLTFNAGPTPDFDGDGMVGFSDFLEFAGQYGALRGDGRYQVRYDLNGDGRIGFSDFLSFARSYGNTIPPTSGGGGGSPDLIVESVSVSESTLTSGQSFTLQVTVRNRGTWQSTSTTLRYYRSSNSTITTDDTEVGTADAISALAASATSEQSSNVTAPLTTGTYYYGACVASVSGENNTNNNCSDGVRVTVEGSPDPIVESPSVSDSTLTPGQSFTLRATVRNRGTGRATEMTLRYYRSSNSTITTDDTEVGTADAISALAASATSEQSSNVTAPLTTGTYYYGACVASVSGENNTNNNCSDGVRVTVSGGGEYRDKMAKRRYWSNQYNIPRNPIEECEKFFYGSNRPIFVGSLQVNFSENRRLRQVEVEINRKTLVVVGDYTHLDGSANGIRFRQGDRANFGFRRLSVKDESKVLLSRTFGSPRSEGSYPLTIKLVPSNCRDSIWVDRFGDTQTKQVCESIYDLWSSHREDSYENGWGYPFIQECTVEVTQTKIQVKDCRSYHLYRHDDINAPLDDNNGYKCGIVKW